MTKEKSKGTVRLDPPSIAPLPGNTVTFVADLPNIDKVGRQSVMIETARDTWMGVPSVSAGAARQAKILETGHGEITVTFYEDGEEYASGTFEV